MKWDISLRPPFKNITALLWNFACQPYFGGTVFIVWHLLHASYWNFTKDHRVVRGWKEKLLLFLKCKKSASYTHVFFYSWWIWSCDDVIINTCLKNHTPRSCTSFNSWSSTVGHLCNLCWHYSLHREQVLFFFFSSLFFCLFGIQDFSRQMYYITVQSFHVHSGTVQNRKQQLAHKDNNVEFKKEKKKRGSQNGDVNEKSLLSSLRCLWYFNCTKTDPDHLQLVQLSLSFEKLHPCALAATLYCKHIISSWTQLRLLAVCLRYIWSKTGDAANIWSLSELKVSSHCSSNWSPLSRTG